MYKYICDLKKQGQPNVLDEMVSILASDASVHLTGLTIWSTEESSLAQSECPEQKNKRWWREK